MTFWGMSLLGLLLLQGADGELQFRSTDRLPGARGKAAVDYVGGTAGIEVKLDGIKPASLFGGDYNTYVLWAVSPGGQTRNLGEVPLSGDGAKLRASSDSVVGALLVTAEPHHLVTLPSPFVVMKTGDIHFTALQGVYYFERTTLSDVKAAKGPVHTELKQAFTAFRLAQRANARTLASREFAEAERALDLTMELSRRGASPLEIAAHARECIELAVAAQRVAESVAKDKDRVSNN